MEYVDALLKLLDNEELLALFAKVTRAQSVVRWPEQPGDGMKKAQIREIHVRVLAAGFDRGLGNDLQECVSRVRANLKKIAPNGILPSGYLLMTWGTYCCTSPLPKNGFRKRLTPLLSSEPFSTLDL